MNNENYGLIAIGDDKLTQITIEDCTKVFKTLAEYAKQGMYNEIIVYRLSDGMIRAIFNVMREGEDNESD